MPTQADNAKLVARRHPEWRELHTLWDWLYDSWEGGERYRSATYGSDSFGLPVYNLVRHKHEKPQTTAALLDRTGSDPNARAWEDEFQYRRARTPIPAFVEYAADAHLSKLYAREVERSGPEAVEDWWKDVDGKGSTIDDWMQDVVAPLLLVLGQIDVYCDHPRPPDGAEIRSKADEDRYRLSTCVAKYILPQNMLWWTLDAKGAYTECLVKEVSDAGDCRYRHWTATGSTLYDEDGREVVATPHNFGRVPIVRVFDRRSPRHGNCGRSRYETIAGLQREFYNRDSELILSDTHQAHPLLQGPEDYCKPDSEMAVGPNWLLPKKKTTNGATASYEGFDVVQFPKDGAASIRANKADILDAVDRNAHLTKPAGTAGTTGQTVAQSGVSKRLDQASGNDLLSKISARIESAEVSVARLAGHVLGVGESEAIAVEYPRSFDLETPEELAQTILLIQQILAASGKAPETESELINRLVRIALPGLDDEDYRSMRDELEGVVKAQSAAMADREKQAADAAKATAEAPPSQPAIPGEPLPPRPQGAATGDPTPP